MVEKQPRQRGANGQFAEQLAGSELTRSLAGILRILRTNPEISQQDLAARIGVVPSRLVAIVDDLEDRGWLTRSRGTVDRRVNRLALTEVGDQAFAELATVARQHESTVTAGLTDPEIRTLRELLTKLADLRGLAPGVHPGTGPAAERPPSSPADRALLRGCHMIGCRSVGADQLHQ